LTHQGITLPEIIECPKCGGEVPDDLKICFLCGHVIKEREAIRNFVEGDPIPHETELRPELGNPVFSREVVALICVFLFIVLPMIQGSFFAIGIGAGLLGTVISLFLMVPIWAFLRKYRRVAFWLRHGGKEEIWTKKEELQDNVRSSAGGAADRIAEAADRMAETAATSQQIGKGAGIFAKSIASKAADSLKGYAEGQNQRVYSKSEDPSERLKTIDELLKSGQITEEEHAEKRTEILDQI
jgi:hypothetical protein